MAFPFQFLGFFSFVNRTQYEAGEIYAIGLLDQTGRWLRLSISSVDLISHQRVILFL